MNDQNDFVWIAQATTALDESARDLDAATLSRLNRVRQAALQQKRSRRVSWMLPAGLAGACAMVLAIGVWHGAVREPALPTLPNAELVHSVNWSNGADDLELVANEDNIELYQDLDFYAWLDTQNQEHDG
ncbi:hypothetical protein ELE36_01605 [Pseudolysobacter antarcticus]|uniref:DUF3619 family protein n=1 Tax=Pseudolysobacter antarcticus TaxID=2511995 RepID=A0A411HFE7_9GAMM|nr:hypothetical protein [Pseudolysobacter antarcticus]QBB69174.1 hypothetical protein ELE36_01605 [Pseudolysobacter antarcticus]